ncbi:MAG: DUF1214 domain-containing protein [Halioglobus sp.]|nr:DUF1214 domain-containing protein [Halioglobus sp.]
MDAMIDTQERAMKEVWRKTHSAVVASLLLAAGQTGAADAGMSEIEAWRAFCAQLERAGVQILNEHRPPNEIDRAEGALYLAQQLSYVVGSVLDERQKAFPLLRVQATTINKWGLDGADAKYTASPIQGSGVYRLHGRLGSARLIAIQLAQTTSEYRAFKSLSGEEFGADENGDFEIMISQQRPKGWKGPWLQMNPAANRLLVRQYFGDWETEQPSDMMLERVDWVDEEKPLSVAEASRLLSAMNQRFANRSVLWMPWLAKTRKNLVNRFEPITGNEQGLKNNAYGEGWFRIGDDEALVIELDKPQADLWSFQLGNYWWESIDYINGTGSLNGDQAVASSDGRYRLVISLRDPGVLNWLDPAGHNEGAIMYRYQNTDNAPVPKATLIKFDQLRVFLPDDTPLVTVGQRRADIETRRIHAARRWAP